MDRHRQRGGGPPARGDDDQEVPTPVQRAVPGRQVLPLPRRHPRRGDPAGDGRAGQEAQGREVLRPVRPRLRHPGHARPADPGLPHPHLPSRRLRPREAGRAAVPPLRHRPVLGAVRRSGDAGGASQAHRRLLRVHGRGVRAGDPQAAAGDDRCRRGPPVRAGGPHPRPARRGGPRHRAPADGHRASRGPRRHRLLGRRAGGDVPGLLRPPGQGDGPQGVHRHSPADPDDPQSALHAKLAIVDQQYLLATSANLSYHGLLANIEVGVEVQGIVAAEAWEVFSRLIEVGVCKRVEVR